MLNPPLKDHSLTQSRENSPTPSDISIPSSPAVLRTRSSIVSLNRLSVSSTAKQFTVFILNVHSDFNINQGSTNLTPYRPPALTPTKHRVIRLWSETWGKQTASTLTNQEIKRQEVSSVFN